MSNTNHGVNDGPLEKDFSNGYHLDGSHDPDDALRKIRTTGSLSISPELFEKIYLSPQNKVAGDLRKTLGNPTPYALAGFLLTLTPLSMDLMGFRGATATGAAGIGTYFAFGGILMSLGAIGEWILGNTFPSVVFGTFGSFWFSLGITLTPYSGAIGDYSLDPVRYPFGDPTSTTPNGLASVGFNVGWGFFLVCMGALCLVYSICALRTNLVLFLILFLLVPDFGCLTAAYFFAAKGNATAAAPVITAAGGISFVICMLGWYLFSAIMLASVDFPLNLPVVDLSHMIKGASEKKKNDDAV